MKLPAILVIVLLLPSVSVGQTDDLLLDFDVSAPVHDMEVEVGFRRTLWNSIGLIIAPDVVKREWPLYAYDPGRVLNDSDGPCQDGSRFAGLTVGHDVALITAQASGRPPSVYTGLKLRPRSRAGAVLGFNDLCKTLQDDQSRIQHTLDGYFALQPWMQPVDSGSPAHLSLICRENNDKNEQDSNQWVPLTEGIVTHVTKRDTSWTIEWNIHDSRSILSRTSAAQSDSPTTPTGNIWCRFHSVGNEASEQPSNLLVTFGHQTDDYKTDDYSISPGRQFRIWYEPSTSEENEIASWYLLSDEPVPGVASDLRIDRQAFAGINNLPVVR